MSRKKKKKRKGLCLICGFRRFGFVSCCDDHCFFFYDRCNKLFTTPEQVEFHAAKTNHSQFSESTEEKKPLTEDEKKEQLNKIEELMKQKRREREEKERAEQLEREKKRIQSGKEMTQIRKKIEDDEIKKLAEERRREKEEEKKARQRVKEQIEQDKLARKMKAEMSSQPPAPAVQPQTQQPPAPAKEYKETRIQIRYAGSSIKSVGNDSTTPSLKFVQVNQRCHSGAGLQRQRAAGSSAPVHRTQPH